MPTLPEEIMLEPDNVSEIPLVGKYSIAKSLEIKTDVSTKLSNMIAISANSDVEGKSTLSTNGDSFGFINTSYKDRFIPIKGDVTGSVKSNQDTVKAAAIQFNQTISDFYSKINPSEANVSQATNYYIERMSKVKNDEYPTRASAMIPVSINFTTDGISGFTMGQAFTVSDQLLPYTYNNRIVNQQGLSREHVNKVGFVVVGLTNTIENNQWNTAVRANMIFLKYKSDFKGSIKRLTNFNAQFGVSPNNITNPVDISTGPINLPNNIKNSAAFKQFIAIPGVAQRVQQLATKLGVKSEDLYLIFYKETAGTFNPAIQNKKSKAVGLIQFVPDTAARLGVTTDQLKTMGAVKQLDYIEKYFGNRKFNNAYDLYLFVFFPLGVGKPSSFILQSKNQSAQLISSQNPTIATSAGKRPGDPLTVNDFYIYVKKSLIG